MTVKKQVLESAAYVRSRLAAAPEIGIVLGSGLGPLAEDITRYVFHMERSRTLGHPRRRIMRDGWFAARWQISR